MQMGQLTVPEGLKSQGVRSVPALVQAPGRLPGAPAGPGGAVGAHAKKDETGTRWRTSRGALPPAPKAFLQDKAGGPLGLFSSVGGVATSLGHPHATCTPQPGRRFNKPFSNHRLRTPAERPVFLTPGAPCPPGNEVRRGSPLQGQGCPMWPEASWRQSSPQPGGSRAVGTQVP